MQDDSHSRARRLGALIGARLTTPVQVLGLVVAQWLLLRNVRLRADLHVWDEVHYYAQGLRFWQGDFSTFQLEWAPLHSLLYGLLAQLPLPGVPADAMLLVAGTGSTLALWWCARAFLPPAAAMLVATWWAANPILLAYRLEMLPVSVRWVAFAIVALAAGFAARAQWWRMVACLVAFYFVRPDSWTATLLCGIAFCAWGWWGERLEWRRPGLVLVAAGLLLALVSSSSAGVAERSWGAFQQHYAQAAWLRQGSPTLPGHTDAMDDSAPWVRKDFPHATSVRGALRENPRALLRHVAANSKLYVVNLVELWPSSFAHRRWLQRGILLGLLALVLAGMLRAGPRLRATFGVCPRPAWIVLLATAVGMGASLLVVYPWPELLVMSAGPLLHVAAGCLVVGGWRGLFGPAPARRRGLDLLVPVAVCVAVALAAPRLRRRHAAVPPHRAAVAMVQRFLPRDRPGRFLSVHADAYLKLARRPTAVPLDVDKLSREPGLATTSFPQLVASQRPDYILQTPRLLDFESAFPGLARELSSDRWRRTEVRPGYVWLARRAP